MTATTYTCLRCITPAERCGAVVAACSALGMLGSEEEAHDAEVHILAYFGASADPRALREGVERAGASSVSVDTLAEHDWDREWRESVQPVGVAPGVWAAPQWRPPRLQPGERWIRIEPAQAFGTGHHESTRLATRAVARAANGSEIRSMLDIGTGSGLLCLLARNCGLNWCLGLDVDPQCLSNLSQNRAANPDCAPVSYAIGTVQCLRAGVRFDLVVMNMIYTLSSPLLDTVRGLLASSGRFVWSGLLQADRERTLASASSAGLCLLEETGENEWWAGVFTSPG